MKILTYFILGIIFIQWCVPIGDSLTELIVTAFEALKGRLGLHITKTNMEIKHYSAEPEQRLIGFKLKADENEEKEDDDDEYDDK